MSEDGGRTGAAAARRGEPGTTAHRGHGARSRMMPPDVGEASS
ncbi:hypothetical protein [Nocardia sp. NPDC057455]